MYLLCNLRCTHDILCIVAYILSDLLMKDRMIMFINKREIFDLGAIQM